MTKKENARRILTFDQPERIVTGMPVHNMFYRGCNQESLDGTMGHDSPVGSRWRDVWGVVWEKRQPGIMGFPVEHPIDDVSKVDTYVWPDPEDPRICAQIDQMAHAKTDPDTFLCGNHRNLLLEEAEVLVGMEELMTWFFDEPEALRALFARYMDFQLAIARHYLSLGVEVITCSEDLGTQISTLVSPKMFDTFLAPEYDRLFSLYRAHGVLIEFHSCGHIEPFLERFIDLGIHILNPIQGTANNLETVRRVTQGRIALHGGVRSDILLEGSAEDIERETRACMRILGRDGGYFCDMDQVMDYKPESLQVMRDTIERYGRYPLIDR